MPKISATNSKGLFIGYFIKIIASSLLSILILCALSSVVIEKMDISLSVLAPVSIGIVVITAILISIISTTGFKNNYLLLNCIAVAPLAIFVFINFLINSSSAVILFVKLGAIFISAIIVSIIKSAKKR